MENESTGRIWPLALIALVAIGAYAYSTVGIRFDPTRSRAVGGVEDIEALADRTDTNILFVVIDTLRAEHMSVYGYERETTPFMRTLADSGIRFDRHTAQSSWTKSSMASLWSSLNPIRSGVTKFNHVLPSDVRTPAEILAEAGFKTVGLYRNGWVHGYFGFDQGFEKYYRPAGVRVKGAVQKLRPNAQAFGTDELLVSDTIEFLRIHGHTSRWFLYLHLMDLHEYTYDDESAKFGNAVPDLYDNSLLRTDWVVSTIYEHLAKVGLLDETIVVVLSDHGEAFGERGYEGHARTVFPETTETPLIISLPFVLPSGVVVTERTTNLDVWPTLLDLLGLPDQGEIDGRSRREAILGAAEGGAPSEEAGDYSFAFLDENWGRPGSGRKAAVAVLEGKYRYVAGTDNGGRAFEMLLSTDDDEMEDQSDREPEIAERLRSEAQRHLESVPAFETETYDLDEIQLDQLRALGYELP
ncbi:MAG: hypothetical protein CL908_24050 [Deltaproteobacteria bacterium]|jgi:arylsulfatase A-like enzyme|nr:hypothetical protein [Deltaproteobacteria bacterium]